MKTRTLTLGGLVALLGAATTLGVLAQNPPVVTNPVAPRQARARHTEKHPELVKALRALQRAKADLQNAAHDFDGHREQALDLTQKAIDQVNMAIQSDKG